MYKIEQVTNAARQTQTLVLPDGTSLLLSIYFIPMQLGWFITDLQYGDFELRGVRITNNPNILRQWRNIIPFGLACLSPSKREPTLQDDFATDASSLYILTEAEVLENEEILSGQI